MSENILKNSTYISNITKHVENPNRTLRCSIFDCLPIYYLLIIAITDSALLVYNKYFKILQNIFFLNVLKILKKNIIFISYNIYIIII